MWSKVGRYEISSKGDYIAFMTENEPTTNKTLTIKPTDNSWEKKYVGAIFSGFTNQDRSALITKSDGQTIELDLKTQSELGLVSRIPQHQPLKNINVQKSRINNKRIIIQSIFNKNLDSIENVINFTLSATGNALILNIEATHNQPVLYWYDLKTSTRKKIWEGLKDQQIEFVPPMENCNHNLFKKLEPAPAINQTLAEVDVWSYKDANYPNPYLSKNRINESLFSISTTGEHVITNLTEKSERLVSAEGDFALIEYRAGQFLWEATWNKNARATLYCISMKTGEKKLVDKQIGGKSLEAKMSPDGRYIIIADNNINCYKSYNTNNGETKIISKNGQITFTTLDEGIEILPFDIFWLEGNSFIIRDDYDLWELDASGKAPAVNLTKGFGRENKLVYNIIPVKYKEGHLLLNTFNEKNKEWGFYSLDLSKNEVPSKLNMGRYYYGGDHPIITKATNSNTYILTRETNNESPNLFATNDFKTFTKLSNAHPENNYNWMTAELITWEGPDRRSCSGILYKPEDFDPNKQYPLMVNVYNSCSDQINSFMEPAESSVKNGFFNWLPAAWLVSNRYLVFVPDVNYRKPHSNLQSSLQIVVSGIKKLLETCKYINGDKIGVQGSSWGGEQVNYIVTHTNIFAAAFTGSGFSDQISRAGFSDRISDNYNLPSVESQEGGLLTEVPERYINESPLFAANNITAPLLIKHNLDDGAVPFYQGLQFFRLLRRLNKRVWLLQYDGGGHGINPGKNLDDFNLRLAQFFDYYLRNSLPPKWMTVGIPPEMKQMNTGLELDSSNSRP
ncbi:Dipeptidyl aminopeptidase/acylaminoacyl peptidase [Chitinophaga filiformis]|uniref:Dipeptidyl aminopeptidase/acylaminoacyl peptidase n=2 Tax=Chitinophaga filiformis TaxID=104663 RepID=A0A1G7HKN6_CHIFI|nr:Dipeptidyl aminopeptidase/acylaminoacyl peptidase [Chitinophaga filiformis]